MIQTSHISDALERLGLMAFKECHDDALDTIAVYRATDSAREHKLCEFSFDERLEHTAAGDLEEYIMGKVRVMSSINYLTEINKPENFEVPVLVDGHWYMKGKPGKDGKDCYYAYDSSEMGRTDLLKFYKEATT